jgi:hypothetical protein
LNEIARAPAFFACDFASFAAADAAALAPQKKLCTERICGRVCRPAEAQNARIGVNRFAKSRLRRPIEPPRDVPSGTISFRFCVVGRANADVAR